VTFLPVESISVGLYALALSIISFNWFAYNISSFTRSPLTATIVPSPFMSNTYVYNIDSKNVM
jgi:hypothetical protein